MIAVITSNLENEIAEDFTSEILTDNNFNPIVYHSKFKSLTSDDNIKNKNYLFAKDKNQNIVCFHVADLTEKEVQNMTPYSPAITINNEQLIDKSIFDKLIPTKGKITYVGKNVSSERKGETQPLEVKYREYEDFMKVLQPYIKANAEINLHNLCPIPEAIVHLKTAPNAVAYTRQYPVAYALQPVVREQIQKWADDRTIEPAKPSGFNSPLTIAPKGSPTLQTYQHLGDVSNVNTPLIDDIYHEMRESKIYSVFDISGAFTDWKLLKKIATN
ncbi:hypothetical protein BX666DRAFT_2034074 [Dichotomocladium elegans]|nr:hypothetical protein BX666DRAFT_2034074 [Dichotomocladium elegans]